MQRFHSLVAQPFSFLGLPLESPEGSNLQVLRHSPKEGSHCLVHRAELNVIPQGNLGAAFTTGLRYEFLKYSAATPPTESMHS